MKVVIVSAGQLGINCWLPHRLTKSCASCQRYDACVYPERVADVEYDALRLKAKNLKAESDEIYRQLNIRTGRK